MATLLMLLTLIKPVRSSSKRSKILLIPFWGLNHSYSGFFVAEPWCDTVEELLEIDLSSFCFEVSNHVENGGVFGLEAERLHGRLELSGVDFASGFSVEQIEGFSELFDFVFSEAWSLDFFLEAALDWLFSFHWFVLNLE